MTESGVLQVMMMSLVAGVIACVACGLGVLPLAFDRGALHVRLGQCYEFAGGLMFAAAMYDLLLPAFIVGAAVSMHFRTILPTLVGLALGSLTISGSRRAWDHEQLRNTLERLLGGRAAAMVFFGMMFHSSPEGIAIGIGFGSEHHLRSLNDLGPLIAAAIAIHNLPEGFAVALPMRAAGASLTRCFVAACLTSLPQPLAAVPASLGIWWFEPLLLPSLGFAAGAMMHLVVVELLPDAFEQNTPDSVAKAFLLGFGFMVLIQVALPH